jgi:hypothetical protein
MDCFASAGVEPGGHVGANEKKELEAVRDVEGPWQGTFLPARIIFGEQWSAEPDLSDW